MSEYPCIKEYLFGTTIVLFMGGGEGYILQVNKEESTRFNKGEYCNDWMEGNFVELIDELSEGALCELLHIKSTNDFTLSLNIELQIQAYQNKLNETCKLRK